MLLHASPSLAADDAAIMEQLKAMQAQMQTMQQQITQLESQLGEAKQEAAAAKQEAVTAKKDAAAAKATRVAGTTNAVSDSDIKITMSPAPKFETADGAYSFKVGGFAQMDAAAFNDDRTDHPDGTTIRRARINVSGKIANDFEYKIENDFASNSSTLTDVYLKYSGFEDFSIMMGQFKEPFSLETLTSDLHTTFTERSLPVAFSPERNIGIAFYTNGDGAIGSWTAAAGFFGANAGTASTNDEAKDWTARLTVAPVAEKDKVLHFGVAGSLRTPDSANDRVAYSSRAENRIQSAQTVSTGNITNVDRVELVGLEAAGVYGPFSVQGEYMSNKVDRAGALADPTFDSYYVEASYFLTGESRNYDKKSAKFDRVKPKAPFSMKDGTWGAWQVAARYSAIDLTDAGITGGELDDITLALKWIPLPNVMFSLNYIMADSDNTAVSPNDDPQIALFRAQFDF